MNKRELDILVREVRNEVSANLVLDQQINDDDIREFITTNVIEKSRDKYLNLSQKNLVINTVFNSMRKLDVIQPLLEDEAITEIMINSPQEIFIEKAGKTKQLDIAFESSERLHTVIQSIVSKVNRIVNESSPIVDARLEDGSRVNVVLPPIALKGPAMTIRKFSQKPLTFVELVEAESLTVEAVQFLEKLVQAKYNIFISGGTGSGKTTFLNALSNFIPPDERVITIEDSAELRIMNIKNLVSLETRNSNTEGKGEITIRDLIKNSLRMRPDRIIVGEVRGPEALDMLQAMNTGHDGSISTGHANSTKDMFSRLETMVLSGASLPLGVIKQQIAAAIDIIIHLGRLRDGTRKVLEIAEISGCFKDEIILNPLFLYEGNFMDDQKTKGALKRTENKLVNTNKFKMAGINVD